MDRGPYIDDVIILYESIEQGCKAEIESLNEAGNEKVPKELNEKLYMVEDFLVHLRKIRQSINRYFIHKSQIPDFLWIEGKNKKTQKAKEQIQMDEKIWHYVKELYNPDDDLRSIALQYILDETKTRVNWANKVWDQLVVKLTNGNNKERAVSVQVLTSLAKSNRKRMVNDFEKILQVTRDADPEVAKFALQSLWKVAIVNPELRQMVTDALSKMFKECIQEEDRFLKRYDIIENFRKIHRLVKDYKLKEICMELIASESNIKWRSKYVECCKAVLNMKKKNRQEENAFSPSNPG